MIDRYHPDLLYCDSPLPYPDEFGRKLLAHYYNDSAGGTPVAWRPSITANKTRRVAGCRTSSGA